MKNYKKRIVLFLILIYMIVPQIILADDGKVKTGPELVESIPQIGATSVSVDTEIYLLFNKNVVNMNVKENNRNNIKLIDGDGKEVPIEIVFADDQIEPEKRREIIIKPVEPLAKSSTYKVQIFPDFMAKNGKTVGKLTEVKFETEKEKRVEPSKEKKVEEVVETAVKLPVEGKNEKIENKETAKGEEADNDESKDMVDEEEIEELEELEEEKSNELDDIERNVDDSEEVLDKTDDDNKEKKPKSKLARNISILVIMFAIVVLILIKTGA
ncbi:MAG: Ig-like domain-containing protein [Tissierellia bacterium]|nr:Ig-like domain-containing protein [Tissierellia bacterium]